MIDPSSLEVPLQRAVGEVDGGAGHVVLQELGSDHAAGVNTMNCVTQHLDLVVDAFTVLVWREDEEKKLHPLCRGPTEDQVQLVSQLIYVKVSRAIWGNRGVQVHAHVAGNAAKFNHGFIDAVLRSSILEHDISPLPDRRAPVYLDISHVPATVPGFESIASAAVLDGWRWENTGIHSQQALGHGNAEFLQGSFVKTKDLAANFLDVLCVDGRALARMKKHA